jgi:hypothetical protein
LLTPKSKFALCIAIFSSVRRRRDGKEVSQF